MLLLCSFFRLKELFKVKLKWFNYIITFIIIIIFLKMPKIWVGRTTLNGEMKGDGLTFSLENLA